MIVPDIIPTMQLFNSNLSNLLKGEQHNKGVSERDLRIPKIVQRFVNHELLKPWKGESDDPKEIREASQIGGCVAPGMLYTQEVSKCISYLGKEGDSI